METKAKREYNRISGELLKKSDRKLTQKLELLRLFLESADFNKLRSESEKYLVEGKKVKFILYLEDKKPKYDMKILE